MAAMDALIALAGVAAYLAVGWRMAVRGLPVAWANARREWHLEATIRGSVKAQTICMLLFWPVFLTVRAVSARLGTVIDAGDPVRLKAQVAERDARIAEMERELGIR